MPLLRYIMYKMSGPQPISSQGKKIESAKKISPIKLAKSAKQTINLAMPFRLKKLKSISNPTGKALAINCPL